MASSGYHKVIVTSPASSTCSLCPWLQCTLSALLAGVLKNHLLVGGFNQPIWKICLLVKLDHFPKVSGWKFNKCLKLPPGHLTTSTETRNFPPRHVEHLGHILLRKIPPRWMVRSNLGPVSVGRVVMIFQTSWVKGKSWRNRNETDETFCLPLISKMYIP